MATLKQLHIFVAVAETLHMSAAAQKLYISQSTVSQTISDLEREFHITLFERFPKALRLTPQGKLFLDHAQQVIETYERLDTSVRNCQARRELRIGATITIGNTLLGKVARQMRENHLDIHSYFRVDNTRALEQALLHRELDIALIEGIVISDRIAKIPLVEDTLELIVSHDHPFWGRETIQPQELRDQPFILREQGSGTRSVFEDYMRIAKIPIQVIGESTSSTAIIEMVVSGMGLGVLSKRCVERYTDVDLVHSCTIQGMPMTRYFYICYHQQSPVTSQMSDFIQAVKQVVSGEKPVYKNETA